MDIQHLKAFIAVTKEKSFSRAANKTFVTQSRVSQQIKALEEEVGTPLFERINPQRTKLTKAGSELLNLSAPLVSDFDSLKDRFLENLGIHGQVEIKIATHEPVITYLLPGPIKVFKKSYPDAKISLYRKDKKETLSAVLQGEVDMGISSPKNISPSVNYQVIGRYDRLVVAPKKHPLSKKKKISLEDIAKYPLLLPPSESSTRSIVEKVFRESELDYTLALEATGREAVKAYIELGFGISILNESLMSKADRKKFYIRNVSKYFGQSERGIIVRRGKVLSKPLDKFISILKKNNHSESGSEI